VTSISVCGLKTTGSTLSSQNTEFSNKGTTLVLQFSVKHEQNLGCGSGYINLLGSDVDQKKFGGNTPPRSMLSLLRTARTI
jgi:hypothetical protein